MFVARITTCLIFLVTNLIAHPAQAQRQENIVLLPIEISPEFEAQRDLIGGAIEQALSRDFNVFYGDAVENALKEEYAKEDCSADACVQNLAVKFNGELFVDASVQLVADDTFFKMKIENVLTGAVVAIVQDACSDCSFRKLVQFIDKRASNLELKSSEGLSALLQEEQPSSDKETDVVTSIRTEKSVGTGAGVVQGATKGARKPEPTFKKQPAAKSNSYWKWGLGALVLGAAGGGGGGGGGGGNTNDAGDTVTPTALLPNPITWTANNTDLLGQSKRVVFTHPSDANYASSQRIRYNLNPSASYGLEVSDSGVSPGFDFEFQIGPDGNQQVAKFDYGNGDLTFDVAYGDTVGRSMNGFRSSLLYYIEEYDQSRNEDNYGGYDDAKIVVLLGKWDQSYPYDSFQHHQYRIEGVFDEGDNNEFTYLDLYAFVSGEVTSVSNRPTSGSTVFNGWSVGHYTFKDDDTFKEYFTQSEVQATIDWTTPQNIYVNSIETEGRLIERLVDYTNYSNNIDLGHLDFSTTTGFTNFNQDAGSDLTGETPAVSHSIMGPNGEEVAGTFTFTSDTNGKTGYIGAFGAVQ